MAFVPIVGPAGLFALRMMRHHQASVGNVAHNRGSRGDIDIVADPDWRYKLGVAADHASIADLGAMLLVAVVINRNDAAPDVGFAAHRCIAQIAQVAGLGAVTNARLFGFDKIADAVVALKLGALAQMRERSQLAVVANAAS